jgi:hypothetical protein
MRSRSGRNVDRQQPQFTRSLSKRLTQSVDRGLANQNPNETPGSVQSAAFNHYNRVKPHMSTSNIPGSDQYKQNPDLRESQEELDIDQGGEYTVADNYEESRPPRLNIAPGSQQYRDSPDRRINSDSRYQPSLQQPLPFQHQQQQQSYSSNRQFSGRQQDQNMAPSSILPKLGQSYMDRIPKDTANYSNRSTDSRGQPLSSYQQPRGYQQQPPKSTTVPNIGQAVQMDPIDPLEEYYTVGF